MSPRPARVFIGLGSNLDNPPAQLSGAFDALAALDASTLVAVSPCYRSAALGPPGQPDYVNAVAMLDTLIEPLRLLSELQGIERAHGRVRGVRWGPRTLDLDLLLYGNRIIDLPPRLRVPHPEIANRPFVLRPLHDLAPAITVPGQGQLARLLKRHAAAHLPRVPCRPPVSAG